MTAGGAPSTLNEILLRRAALEPERRAYSFLVDGEADAAHITYGELDQRARALAASLRGACAAGDRALLVHPPGIGFVTAFFACLYAGVTAVPAYPPEAKHARVRLDAIVRDARPSVVLGDARAAAALALPLVTGATELHAVSTTSGSPPLATDWHPAAIDPASPALLQYTSGSTATPKGVVVTHANLVHNQGIIARAFEHDRDSVIVSWLPVYHDMGLTNVLQALYAGIPCILMSPTHFLHRPARWLEAISRHRGTTSGGPNFAYELCLRRIAPEQRRHLDLSSWRVAYNGSEPVRAGTLRRFAEAFAPQGFQRSSLRPCYGLAEATLMVACSTAGEATKTLESADRVSCGAAPGHRLAIVGPGGVEVPEGQAGEIWVSGPSVAAGYWNRPEETEATFRARLSGSGEGPFLRTGDLGLVQGGELFVTSRLKDLIIVRGQNYHPQDIELTVELCHPSLSPGSGAAFGVEIGDEERVVLVQEVPRARAADAAALAQSIGAEILEEHALQVAAVVLIKPGTLPRTTSGKVRRAACRELFLGGQLAVVGEWREASVFDDDGTEPPRTLASIQAWLVATAAARLGVDPGAIDADQPMGSHRVDSLAAVDLAHRVESRFGVALPVASFFGDASLSALAARVRSEVGEARDAPATLEAKGARSRPGRLLPGPEGPLSRAEGALSHGEHTLSRPERARWLLEQALTPERAINTVARAARVLGDLDAAALRRSLERLVDRHPALRTTFSSAGGAPERTVHPRLAPHFAEHDARGLDDARFAARLDEEARRPFDLARGPLLRVDIFQRGAGQILLFAVHHIVVDLWSLEILLVEWAALYAEERGGAPAHLPPLAWTPADHARREDARLRADEERHCRYWEARLAGDLPTVTLPNDRLPPSPRTHRGASIQFVLEEPLSRGLFDLAEAERVTPYMLLLATLDLLLHRYTGQEDVVVGSPTAGRRGLALSNAVGCFVNPVAIRVDLSGDPTFSELLVRVREAVAGALEHQEYPFDALVERLRPERRPGRPPLFDVLLVWAEPHEPRARAMIPLALDDAGARLDFGGLTLETLPLSTRATLFDLELSAGKVGAEIHGALTYDTDLFEASTAAGFVEHLRGLLESLLDAPGLPISRISVIGNAERDALLTSAEPDVEAPRERLHELFEARAAESPDATAVTFEGEAISYGELNARSDRLARRLRAAGRPVAIVLEDGPPQVIAMLAALKAGSPFVCVDAGQPVARIERILADVAPSHLVSSGALAGSLEGSARARGISVLLFEDEPREAGGSLMSGSQPGGLSAPPPHADGGLSAPPPHTGEGPGSPAYIVYTSGSGGSPKGIVQSHGSFCQFLKWQIERFAMGPPQRIAQVAAISYDAAYCEIFGALAAGSTLCMASAATRRDPAALLAWVEQEAITWLQVVPSFCRRLLERASTSPPSHGDPLRSVAWMLLAGEALPVELARDFLARYPRRPALFNLYGPSESVLATCHPVTRVRDDAPSIPIGRPFAGRQILILDAHRQPCPRGAIGEIYIRSRHLTTGYLGRPEETASAYLAAPSAADPDDRMYRTGDRGRLLSSGDLEFCGRVDEQIKIRGVRVELGEVEATLRRQPSVEDCAAVAQGDGQGGLRVVAYVVSRAPISIAALREAARTALSPQAVPAAFVQMEALPRTRTGKLDRRALPPPDAAAFGAAPEAAPPRSATEQLVAGVWQEILGAAATSVHQSFFELGGHSLTAMQVVNRLRQLAGVELPLALLFEAPTIAGLAERLDAGRQAAEPAIARLVRDIEDLSDEEVESLLRGSRRS